MSEPSRPRPSRFRRGAEALRHPPPGARAVAIATTSTIVLLVVVAFIVVNAPGWERVQSTFFDFEVFEERFEQLVYAFRINIQIFAIAQVMILACGLIVAV